MSYFEIAWELMKSVGFDVVCDFCGKSVPKEEIARSSDDHPPIKPRWEGCYDCLEAKKIITNDGELVKSDEKGDNAPTNPSLWAQAKSKARTKFKVYPSAYANGWAAKWYKSKGGGWKKKSKGGKKK